MFFVIPTLIALLSATSSDPKGFLTEVWNRRWIASKYSTCAGTFSDKITDDEKAFGLFPSLHLDVPNAVYRTSLPYNFNLTKNGLFVQFGLRVDGPLSKGSAIYLTLLNEQYDPTEYSNATSYFLKFGVEYSRPNARINVIVRVTDPNTGAVDEYSLAKRVAAPITDNRTHLLGLRLSKSRRLSVFIDDRKVFKTELKENSDTWAVTPISRPAEENPAEEEVQTPAEDSPAPAETTVDPSTENNETSTNTTAPADGEETAAQEAAEPEEKPEPVFLEGLQLYGAGLEITKEDEEIVINVYPNVGEKVKDGRDSLAQWRRRRSYEEQMAQYQSSRMQRELFAHITDIFKADTAKGRWEAAKKVAKDELYQRFVLGYSKKERVVLFALLGAALYLGVKALYYHIVDNVLGRSQHKAALANIPPPKSPSSSSSSSSSSALISPSVRASSRSSSPSHPILIRDTNRRSPSVDPPVRRTTSRKQ